jgi:hypothetical protein
LPGPPWAPTFAQTEIRYFASLAANASQRLSAGDCPCTKNDCMWCGKTRAENICGFKERDRGSLWGFLVQAGRREMALRSGQCPARARNYAIALMQRAAP